MSNKRIKQELPPAPRSFTDAIRLGAEDIRRYERRKKHVGQIAAAAACVVVCFAVLLTVLLRPPTPDTVLTQTGKLAVTDVWVHPDDPSWHADGNCVNKNSEAVIVPVETAQEFGKEMCEICGR